MATMRRSLTATLFSETLFSAVRDRFLGPWEALGTSTFFKIIPTPAPSMHMGRNLPFRETPHLDLDSSVPRCVLCLILVLCAMVKSYVQRSNLICRDKDFCARAKSSVQGQSLPSTAQVLCAGVKPSVQRQSLICRGEDLCAGAKIYVQWQSLMCRGKV